MNPKRAIIILCVAGGVALSGWRLAAARSPLGQAADFVRHSSSDDHFRGHDVFIRIAGEKKPSDWVAYFLSPIGSGHWITPRELDEIDGWGAVLKCPLVPNDVFFISDADPSNTDSPDPRTRYSSNTRLVWFPDATQVLVIFPDDERSMVRVVGYDRWEPVLEEAWEFPRLPSVPD